MVFTFFSLCVGVPQGIQSPDAEVISICKLSDAGAVTANSAPLVEQLAFFFYLNYLFSPLTNFSETYTRYITSSQLKICHFCDLHF